MVRACAEATSRPLRRPCRQLGGAHTSRLAHGRLEQRTRWAAEAPADVGFPFARPVRRRHRRRADTRPGGALSDETVDALTSRSPQQARPQQLLRLWQRHWGIEHKPHWVREVVFAEDAATTRAGAAPAALAAFRNLALSLLHRWKRPDLTAARRYDARHPAALFRRLGLPSAGL